MRLPRRPLILASLLSLCLSAAAQEFPNRPIKLLVGFAAGGPLDVFTRVLAQEMAGVIGQPVVVENRSGASGQLATDAVAKAEPDGYTLLSTASTFIVNPILSGRNSPDPQKDFAPVAHTAVLPTILVTAPDLPVQSLQDLVKLARTRPMTYSSAGNGGPAHLAGALLGQTTGTQMTHVPYRGAAPGLADVMASRIDFTFYTMSGLKELVTAKRVKPLAITSARRHPDFADVPTMSEAGIAGFDHVGAWFGVVAPAATPAAVVSRLNRAIDQVLNKPEARERIAKMGMIPVGGSSESFKQFLASDSQRWTELIRAANIKE
jgi:tripartite-type tricarboxylate transporter receptor subunit TctC